MSATTKIQWTDRTWNPTRGCTMVSPGCSQCYAMRQAHRFNGSGQPYEGLTRMTEHGPVWTGDVRLVPEALLEPLRWRKPARIFVNSMSDLFYESVPDEFIDRVFAVMALTPRHTYQLLTKRPEWMREYLSNLNYRKEQVGVEAELMSGFDRYATDSPANCAWPLPNVHLGVSVENRATAEERIPILLETPAALRFLSVEPLLEGVDISWYLKPRSCRPDPLSPTFAIVKEVATPAIDWVIVGGESGPNARPCNIDWIRWIVGECRTAGVPVFVKQLGAFPTGHPWLPGAAYCLRDGKGGDPAEWPHDLRVREFPETREVVARD